MNRRNKIIYMICGIILAGALVGFGIYLAIKLGEDDDYDYTPPAPRIFATDLEVENEVILYLQDDSYYEIDYTVSPENCEFGARFEIISGDSVEHIGQYVKPVKIGISVLRFSVSSNYGEEIKKEVIIKVFDLNLNLPQTIELNTTYNFSVTSTLALPNFELVGNDAFSALSTPTISADNKTISCEFAVSSSNAKFTLTIFNKEIEIPLFEESGD